MKKNSSTINHPAERPINLQGLLGARESTAPAARGLANHIIEYLFESACDMYHAPEMRGMRRQSAWDAAVTL
jgi:hypothetical protein